MARTARISVMTTLFSCLALDITVPLVVLATAVVAGECLFLAGDLLLARRRAA